MKKIGFDSEKYLQEQSAYILERVQQYDKLYLEFGGKLIGDKHAKRVLPGFDEDAKIKLLHTLKEKAEIIYYLDENDKVKGFGRGCTFATVLLFDQVDQVINA